MKRYEEKELQKSEKNEKSIMRSSAVEYHSNYPTQITLGASGIV